MLENGPQEYQPTKLIICGGGVKGRAYAPVISVLEETHILPKIKDVYGSSIGAILSTMVSLGYSPQEIQEQLNADGSIYEDATKKHATKAHKIAKILRNAAKDGVAFKGEQLTRDCQAMVEKGGLHPNATFKELEAKVKGEEKSSSGMPYRNLHITATVSDPRGSYQVILDSETAPHMPIALAMRASAALPPVFRAVTITPDQWKAYTAGATKPLVQYDRGSAYHDKNGVDDGAIKLNKEGVKLIDGGLVDNLPQYAVYTDHNPNSDVLSLNLRTPAYLEQKNKFSDKPVTDENERANLIEREKGEKYLEQAFKNSHVICYPPSRLLASKNETIDIPTATVQAADFNMDRETHKTLITAGYEAVKKLLEDKNVANIPDFNPDAFLPSIGSAEEIDIVAKATDLLERVGLGLDVDAKTAKYYATAAKKVQQAIDSKDPTLIAKIDSNNNIKELRETTYQNFNQLNDLHIKIAFKLKKLNDPIENLPTNKKERDQFLKEKKAEIQNQKKTLLALDNRIKLALEVQRLAAVESKSTLAGVKLGKRIIQGGAEIITNTASALQQEKITLGNLQLMRNEIRTLSAPDTKENLQIKIKQANNLIKKINTNLAKLSNSKSEGEIELKEQLIILKEQLDLRVKYLNKGTLTTTLDFLLVRQVPVEALLNHPLSNQLVRTLYKGLKDQFHNILERSNSESDISNIKKELEKILANLNNLQEKNWNSSNKSNQVENNIVVTKTEVMEALTIINKKLRGNQNVANNRGEGDNTQQQRRVPMLNVYNRPVAGERNPHQELPPNNPKNKLK